MRATEQYFPVMLFIMMYKMALTSESVDGNVWPFKWKLLSGTFLWFLFIMLYKVGSENWIPKFDHSNGS